MHAPALLPPRTPSQRREKKGWDPGRSGREAGRYRTRAPRCGWWPEGGDGAGLAETPKGASGSPPQILVQECLRASGKMAARGLGRSLGRLLGSLSWRSGQPARPLRGVSAPAAAAAQPGSYQAQIAQAAREPAAFWGQLARDMLVWDTPYHTVWDCDFSSGKIGWFLGGQLNVSVNCLDQHVRKSPESVALIWERDEPGTEVRITYRELLETTCRLANTLKRHGIRRGDRVAIYMPVSPLAVAAMLACARVGAVHTVVFAGFSAESLAGRINDAKCKVVITFNQGLRGGRVVELKKIVDEAVKHCPTIQHVLVAHRTDNKVHMGRLDIPLEQEMAKEDTVCAPESMSSEDMLFLLYTSGSTGTPKGLVHTQAGYLLYAAVTHRWENQSTVRPGSGSTRWWGTADARWWTPGGKQGNVVEGGDVSGALCLSQAWPGMARTIYGDHQRFMEAYFKPYPGYYFTGDGAYRTEGGYYQITGRMDDVINISGHRLGTAEIEDSMASHPTVAETAVIGYPHDIKGEAAFAFIVLKDNAGDPDLVVKEVRSAVANKIAKYAVPDQILVVKRLPKTRSGKVMRRLLRKIITGRAQDLGDTTTLEDPHVIMEILKVYQKYKDKQTAAQ
uniref:acetyl-coenzyme A synthetase 2-like, mitochondrial isoform X4 n=2 Tax=Panthera TaxID=9688 RepID=UPI0029547CF7|nr:acetyl-coenzyme A synthetase 2-like, mitochondrial isoform X4 [Panthera onca]